MPIISPVRKCVRLLIDRGVLILRCLFARVYIYIFLDVALNFIFIFSNSVVLPIAMLAVGWLFVTRVIMPRDKFSLHRLL